MDKQLLNKINALGHPNPDSVDVNDRYSFASTILWLEDEKIRHYKIEDRAALRQRENLETWEQAYQLYKDHLNCPTLDSPLEELSWFLGYAVRLEFLDEIYKEEDRKGGWISGIWNSIDFHHKDFIKGVRLLGKTVNVAHHPNHLVQLEAISRVVENAVSPHKKSLCIQRFYKPYQGRFGMLTHPGLVCAVEDLQILQEQSLAEMEALINKFTNIHMTNMQGQCMEGGVNQIRMDRRDEMNSSYVPRNLMGPSSGKPNFTSYSSTYTQPLKTADLRKRRANAKRRLKRLNRRDPNSLTKKEVEFKKWAEDFINSAMGDQEKNYTSQHSPTNQVSEQEISNHETASPGHSGWTESATETVFVSENVNINENEKLLSTNTSSQASTVAGCKRKQPDNPPDANGVTKKKKNKDPVKEKLLVTIIDTKNPESKLTEDQWNTVELRILYGISDAIIRKENIIPFFGQMRLVKGFKVFECENQNTLDWLENFITKMDAPWANAGLQIVPKSEIVNLARPKGRVFIEGPRLTKETLELRLRHLNPDLLSDEWKVIDAEDHNGNGMYVTLLLSYSSMSLLRKQKFHIRVGTTRSRMWIVNDTTKHVGQGESKKRKLSSYF